MLSSSLTSFLSQGTASWWASTRPLHLHSDVREPGSCKQSRYVFRGGIKGGTGLCKGFLRDTRRMRLPQETNGHHTAWLKHTPQFLQDGNGIRPEVDDMDGHHCIE